MFPKRGAALLKMFGLCIEIFHFRKKIIILQLWSSNIYWNILTESKVAKKPDEQLACCHLQINSQVAVDTHVLMRCRCCARPWCKKLLAWHDQNVLKVFKESLDFLTFQLSLNSASYCRSKHLKLTHCVQNSKAHWCENSNLQMHIGCPTTQWVLKHYLAHFVY